MQHPGLSSGREQTRTGHKDNGTHPGGPRAKRCILETKIPDVPEGLANTGIPNEGPPEKETALSSFEAEKNLLKTYTPQWATAVRNKWCILDGDMIDVKAALLASEKQKLSGSTLTSQEKMGHAEPVSEARHLKIRKRSERHASERAEETMVYSRAPGTR